MKPFEKRCLDGKLHFIIPLPRNGRGSVSKNRRKNVSREKKKETRVDRTRLNEQDKTNETI